jgi:hypothetical protein
MVESSKSVWSRNQKAPSNPFDVLKKQKQIDISDIKAALNSFDSQRYNISDFVAACITSLSEGGALK